LGEIKDVDEHNRPGNAVSPVMVYVGGVRDATANFPSRLLSPVRLCSYGDLLLPVFPQPRISSNFFRPVEGMWKTHYVNFGRRAKILSDTPVENPPAPTRHPIIVKARRSKARQAGPYGHKPVASPESPE
jgi:hypothetical protein